MNVLKEVFKGFSVKKFLLCVLLSTMISLFGGFTILFVTEFPSYTLTQVLTTADVNSNALKEIGKNVEEKYYELDDYFNEQKGMYGEDYPAEGIFLYNTINAIKSYSIIKAYSLTLLIGIVSGTIIYFIFIQNAKGIQMLLETGICGIIIIFFIILLKFVYASFIRMNLSTMGANIENFDLISNLYNFDMIDIVSKFVIIVAIAYVINWIYQKMLVNMLNDKLNKRLNRN